MTKRKLFIATFLFVLCLAGPAEAAVVSNNADSGPGSLRAVVHSALPGEVITFAQGVNRITLTQPIIIDNKNISLSSDHLLTISGNG